MQTIKIIECPRDAMQGIKLWIPTQQKIDYIQSLLAVGFDTIDFGSFVSPKAIPQMQDTEKVLKGLDLSQTKSKLLVIVANTHGAKEAAKHSEIQYLGYPFSISENFQMRNTHQTINKSLETLAEILEIASKSNKQVVAYLSMGFGNPYGDPWSLEIVANWTRKLVDLGVKIISLSDTIGSANPKMIFNLFSKLVPEYQQIEFGAHLHTKKEDAFAKMDAAFQGGCYRFDGAIQGFGGCPMASDELTGNMPTEKILSFFKTTKTTLKLDPKKFKISYNIANQIFTNLH